MNSEQDIERQIKELELNAPRLSPEDISRKIVNQTYTLLPDGRTTVCQLTLENGYTVVGTSSCVSKENYNKDIGNKISFENAREKIWELEGYLLKERIFKNQQKTSRHWIVKLKAEHIQLTERVENLKKFITSSPIYEKMNYDNKQIYVDQLHSMLGYQESLKKRLDNYVKDNFHP